MKKSIRLTALRLSAILPVLTMLAVGAYTRVFDLPMNGLLVGAFIATGLSGVIRMSCIEQEAQFGLGAATAFTLVALETGIQSLDIDTYALSYVVMASAAIVLGIDMFVQLHNWKSDVPVDPLLSRFSIEPDEQVQADTAEFVEKYDLRPEDKEFVEMQASMAMFIREVNPENSAVVFARLERLKQLLKLESAVRGLKEW